MILFTHPSGNANVRHAALALHRAGLLGEFWTSFHYDAPSWLGPLLPGSMRESLLRRTYPTELHRKIVAHPIREATRVLARRVGLGSLLREESGALGSEAVAHALDRQVAQRLQNSGFQAVYAYEDGAESAFRTAHELGRVTIYDQPTGYWGAARKLFEEEAQREPEWASTLLCDRGGTAKLARKDAELSLADVVLVPSTFNKRTLEQPGLMRARIAVVPYGTPVQPEAFTAPTRTPAPHLRVAYVGPLTQKNGLSYLFAALRELGSQAQLTVFGRRPLQPCAALERALAGGVRHIETSSHADLLRQLSQHDVLVYPTLFDGFGSIMLEAMALGLPVIATPHSAAPDLYSDGVEGFIVPIRSSAHLVDRLQGLQREPERRLEMSRRAAARAREFTWQRYETTLATRVTEALSLAGHANSPSFARPTPEPPLPGVFPRRST